MPGRATLRAAPLAASRAACGSAPGWWLTPPPPGRPQAPGAPWRLQQRHQQQRDDVDDLDQRIDRRSRGVLVGIAHGIAGHGRLVRVGTLAAKVAFLNVLL